MARTEFINLVDELHGRAAKQDKNGGVFRRKYYRDEKGRIIGKGTKEVYYIVHPRDYDKNPLQGEQLANVSAFSQAVIAGQKERENPERLAYWKERWHKQLEKGETDAPIDPKTGRHRIYRRLDVFIQSVLQREIKSGRDDTKK